MFSFFKKKPPLAPDAGADTSAAAPSDAVANTAAAPARQSWLARLKAGLGKTASGLSSVFGGSRIDEALFEDLENALLMADAGVSATTYLIAQLRQRAKDSQAQSPEQLKALLIEALTELLSPLERSLPIGPEQPTVVMVAGILITLTALFEHVGKPDVMGFLFGEPLFPHLEETVAVDS